ncbi:T9SS type A sorting domain-containing protein [Sediminibacter sp. Hel_I_10]|uniref:T9SS type A sorting domain-containing protein n=1 Tax=Sediminibacter sp. Hel_I_10 TaxID=1392490 RepID=UPI00047E5FD7|nr:T9SS type A sorting domain-containing protein [Sediminibacter sp. Hel_I_10]
MFKLLFLFFFWSICAIGQQQWPSTADFNNPVSEDGFLIPSHKASFGLNQHTNRDIVYFTEVDAVQEVLVIGTTERDSTFNDILVTKLDTNMVQLWQKRYSLGTDLSYDVPIKPYIDSDNNLTLVCRSLTKNSIRSGLLYVIKYDSQGNLLWDVNVDEFNTSSYDDYEYQNSFMDETGHLRIVQTKNYDVAPLQRFHFYTIYPNGEIIDSFTEDNLTEIDHINSNSFDYEVAYFNGHYYLKYRKATSIDNDYVSEHFIKKFNTSSMETYQLDDIIDLTNIYNFNESKMKIGIDGGIYFIQPQTVGNSFEILKLNSSGALVYNINSEVGFDKEIIDATINGDDNLILFTNSKPSSSSGNLTFNKTEYDDTGNIVFNVTVGDTYVDGLKLNNEGKVLVYSNTNFKLFSATLEPLGQFNGNYDAVNDFNSLDNTNLVIGKTNASSMFPGSSFQSQQDMEIHKIDENQIISSYTFSGEGTSKANRQKIIQDGLGNYIVASEEKLGPDDWSITNLAPLRRTLYKYDNDLNLIWSLVIENAMVSAYSPDDKNFLIDENNDIYINTMANPDTFELIKVSSDGTIIYQVPSYRTANMYFDENNNIKIVSPPVYNYDSNVNDTNIYTLSIDDGSFVEENVFPGLEFLDQFKNADNESYIYMFTNNDEPYIKIYKNMALEIEQDLYTGSNFGSLNARYIDHSGNIIFSSSYNQINEKLYRLTLDNVFDYISTNEGVANIKEINNKIFTYHSDDHIRMYDYDLNLVTTSTEEFLNMPIFFEYGAFILVNTPFNNNVRVVDENCSVVDEFHIPSSLFTRHAIIDSEGDLVLTGQNGYHVGTFHHYGWARGFIHKYSSIKNTLGTIRIEKSQNDAVIFPNPSNGIINFHSVNQSIRQVEVYDMTGRLINFTLSTTMNVQNLPNAAYIAKITLGNGIVVNKKFIKY